MSKILFYFDFFQIVKNVTTILSLQAIQNHGAGHIQPAGHSLPTLTLIVSKYFYLCRLKLHDRDFGLGFLYILLVPREIWDTQWLFKYILFN